MAINPYTSVAISGYNSSPPPDDGTQSSANKVEWAKHKSKLADPIKQMLESVNTNVQAAANALALVDWTVSTTSATIAESDWNNGILQTSTNPVKYPDPSTLENGWHNAVFNGSTGIVPLTATASTFWRIGDTFASQVLIESGRSVRPMNTATAWIPVGHTATVPASQSFYQFANTSLSTVTTATVVIPNDSTKPSATEGIELMTLAWSAANNVLIDVQVPFSASGGAVGTAALFDDRISTATCVAAQGVSVSAGTLELLSFHYVSTMSSTATRTFSLRFGTNGSHIVVNSLATATAGFSIYGGAGAARMSAQEFTT